ncbi:hypothetical protein [Actibacterium mucosum]|uniref:hypothetical protein n=1 Tax=Actibacterium mucosum TaxID=1087332 RepID=UPI000556D4C8|nr:hypothetical protein [Actibacterium mucosum]
MIDAPPFAWLRVAQVKLSRAQNLRRTAECAPIDGNWCRKHHNENLQVFFKLFDLDLGKIKTLDACAT